MGGLDLFTPEEIAADGVWSVAEINRHARNIVEREFRGPVWVKAEISGFKSYRSGHWYFGIRDKSAQARCVMWRTDNRRVRIPPEDGIEVFLEVQPTVWEERGEFRLTVRQMLATADGGMWQVRLEKARKALEGDGLLDPSRKRRLPVFPKRLGVITSTDGAALRDVVSVASRRWPGVQISVFPALVQGEAAERSLVRSISIASRDTSLDAILVTRGGGSREDLWAFNLETVCRAIANVPSPTIAAIGHETDVTLVELVADARAATPSAATEMLLPDRREQIHRVRQLGLRLGTGLSRRSDNEAKRLERTADRLVSLSDALVSRENLRLERFSASLNALSPLAVLGRGYALVRSAGGNIVRTVGSTSEGDHLSVQVSDGSFNVQRTGGSNG